VILELLRPEPESLRATAAALRIAYYVACLGAAGLGIFALGFRRLQQLQDITACRRMTSGLVAIGLVSSLAWLASQVALASDGDAFDAEIWSVMLTSRPGVSVIVTWAGLLVLAAAIWLERGAVILGACPIALLWSRPANLRRTAAPKARKNPESPADFVGIRRRWLRSSS